MPPSIGHTVCPRPRSLASALRPRMPPASPRVISRVISTDASPSLIRHTTGTHDIHAMILHASRDHPARRGTMTTIHPHTRAYVHWCGSKHVIRCVVSLSRDAVHAHTPPPPRSLTARPARPLARASRARSYTQAPTRAVRQAAICPLAPHKRHERRAWKHGPHAQPHATREDGLHTHHHPSVIVTPSFIDRNGTPHTASARPDPTP